MNVSSSAGVIFGIESEPEEASVQDVIEVESLVQSLREGDQEQSEEVEVVSSDIQVLKEERVRATLEAEEKIVITEEAEKEADFVLAAGLDFTGIEQEMSEVIASREAEDLASGSKSRLWGVELSCVLCGVFRLLAAVLCGLEVVGWSDVCFVLVCLLCFYELQLGSCLGMYLLGSGALAFVFRCWLLLVFGFGFAVLPACSLFLLGLGASINFAFQKKEKNDFQGQSSQKEETATSCNGDTKRMQVCMCGKCKKSGAVDVDVDAGCKCMGKCKKGPNVKLYNSVDDTPANPLFIGVRLEDVDGIVANSLAERNTTITNDMGLNPASLYSTFFLFSAL
ncbi:hypothetical protein QYF36_010237 [Acer negundo]|nr:hypothetical protein QYF36_010237 [Acer negundo]